MLSPLILSSVWVLSLIHFILQVAFVLTAFTHPSHVLMYAPGIRVLGLQQPAQALFKTLKRFVMQLE
ncbi:hypothetical protein BCN13_06350 [Salmonella enterica]|nr:hypothetical protein [Salmonella enterica]EAO7615680.1 hypothetical protein [Salmonella enterica]EAQ6815837.1 hypothetical protein [Salmonella enterica]MIV14834.1 hypothetical protein [Salmonella enterica]